MLDKKNLSANLANSMTGSSTRHLFFDWSTSLPKHRITRKVSSDNAFKTV